MVLNLNFWYLFHLNSKYSTIDNKEGESLLLENNNDEERETFAETGGLYGPWPSPEKHNVFCLKINQPMNQFLANVSSLVCC